MFVKNMSFKVTDKELWDFFTSCGTVTKVAVKRDDGGNSKVAHTRICGMVAAALQCRVCLFLAYDG